MTDWRERLYVPDAKLFDYLLNPAHEDGGPKSRLLRVAGYALDDAEALRAALIEHGKSGTVHRQEDTEYGQKYVVKALLQNSKNAEFPALTAWMTDDLGTRFVTLRPLSRRRESR